MIKNTFIILSLIVAITTQTYTMEIEVETDTFPLLILPLDIQDLIASFLPFHDTESEQEFIERTKTKKGVPKEYEMYCPLAKMMSISTVPISTFCPNNKTVAIFYLYQSHKNFKASSTLIFVDRHTNKKIYKSHPDKNHIAYIAISRNATIFATIHQEEDYSNYFTETMDYKNILSIKNINSQKEEIPVIPENFSILGKTTYPTIAFNKQGTHIILRGHDFDQSFYDDEHVSTNPSSTKDMKKTVHHIIFPLTTTLDQNSDNTKTLAKYFKQRAVCKDFIKQIADNK